MPSFGDSAFIFVLALILFGPKKLPELARQLGKLMAEFRRASNDFRIQMDEELRIADQAEQQKKIAAMEAAAPIAPVIGDSDPEHPHLQARGDGYSDSEFFNAEVNTAETTEANTAATETAPPTPLPIASEGDLSLMPPSTGLPAPRSAVIQSEAHTESAALSPVLENIAHAQEPDTNSLYLASLPDRHTHNEAETPELKTEAPLHG